MNGRERVLNSFARERCDRCPIDYAGNGGITAKLMQHFGVSDYDALLSALDVDFRGIYVPYRGPDLFGAPPPGIHIDPVYGFRTKWVEHATGGYWDFCDFPLRNADSQTIADFPVPDPDDFDYSAVEAYARANRDKAVYVGSAGMADVINSTGRVMGMEDTLVNLMTGDEATMAYIERRSRMELGVLERTIRAAGDSVAFLWMGEDLGTQIAPMISKELYRSVLRPIHQRYIDLAKSFRLPVMVHSCGSSSWVYPDFIEMGVDGVDTLQPEAANMAPAYLAENFGDRLAFHGCISTAGPLAYGTPEELERSIREILSIMMPTRGYMFSPTHAIQDNSPLENVLKMYELGQKLCKY